MASIVRTYNTFRVYHECMVGLHKVSPKCMNANSFDLLPSSLIEFIDKNEEIKLVFFALIYFHGWCSCIPRYLLALPDPARLLPVSPKGMCALARCASVTSGPQQGTDEV